MIGYCSGGRQSFMVACRLDVDAAVDCYGGRADVGLAPGLRCPLLGLFGADDRSPSPADVTAMAKALEANGKTFEFHSYEDAGHAFFSVDRPSYRLDASKDGWKRIWAFFGAHLKEGEMCTYVTTSVEVAGSGYGGDEWFGADRAVVYFDHPQDAPLDHALCIDLWGAGERVAVELDGVGPPAGRGHPSHARPRRGQAPDLTRLDDGRTAVRSWARGTVQCRRGGAMRGATAWWGDVYDRPRRYDRGPVERCCGSPR